MSDTFSKDQTLSTRTSGFRQMAQRARELLSSCERTSVWTAFGSFEELLQRLADELAEAAALDCCDA